MSVKHLTLLVLSLFFLNACGRKVEIREYVEVVNLPTPSRPQLSSAPRGPMQAGPLSVEPVMENLPPDHPTFDQAHPPIAGGGAGPNMMAGRESEVPAPPSVTDLDWELPPGWTEQAGSGMRVAEFFPEPEKPEALVTLIALSGAAGSMPANISRWRGQVGLDPAVQSEIQHLDGHMHFEFITFVNESKELGKPQSIIAAIFQQPGRTLFLKFMGPTDVVAAHKLDFLQLAGSVKQLGNSE